MISFLCDSIDLLSSLDDFRSRLLDHFDGSYEDDIQTYLGCEIERDIAKDTTSLSQKHYADYDEEVNFLRENEEKHYTEEVLCTYNVWDYHPSETVLPPNLRLRKEDCDLTPDPAFHSRYHGIVGSLGLTVVEHVIRYLRDTYEKGFSLVVV